MNPDGWAQWLERWVDLLLYLEFVTLLFTVAGLSVAYRAFWKDLYSFAINYTGLFAILVFLYLIVYGQVGTSFGLQNLFWSEQPLDRFRSSLSATLLLGVIGTLACHLDPYPARSAHKISEFLGYTPPSPNVVKAEGALRARVAVARVHFREGPDTPHMLRLEPFLRAARLPFLVLLALPAFLPDIFPYLPRPVSPLYTYAWIYGASPSEAVSSDFLPAFVHGSLAYLYGLVEWVGGIVAGVFLFKVLMWLSVPTHDVLGGPLRDCAGFMHRSLSSISSRVWTPMKIVLTSLPIALAFPGWLPWQSGLIESAILCIFFFRQAIVGRFVAVISFLNRVVLRWADFRQTTRYTPVPAEGCKPPGGRNCPLVGCPVNAAPGADQLEGCLEREDRDASMRNLMLWFAMFYVLSSYLLYDLYSPSMAICLVLAVLAIFTTVIAYFQPRRKYVLLFGLAGYLVFLNNQVFKDRFEGMEVYYPRALQAGTEPLVKLREKTDAIYYPSRNVKDPDGKRTGPVIELVDNQKSLEAWQAAASMAWKQDGRSRAEKPKLVVVSVSGGAARSAYWSAVVLSHLSDTLGPTFNRSVRIITGTSGGMLGTAYYVEQMYRGATLQPTGKTPWIDEIPTDSLMRLAPYIALRDLPRSFLPRLMEHKSKDGSIKEYDRGTILEDDWTYLGARPLQDYVPREETGDIPSLIFSPMIIEDGRLLLISNLDLSVIARPVKVLSRMHLPMTDDLSWDAQLSGTKSEPRRMAFSQGSKIAHSEKGASSLPYSLSGLEFFKLFPLARHFRVATAVRLNATFPFVSPAVSLPTDPPRHVVDAGYYDNYGIQVSTAWLQMNREWLIHNTSGVLLVQIRDGISQMDRLEIDDHSATNWERITRGFEFLLNPIKGASKARSSTSMFRNDLEVEHLSDWFTLATGCPDFFATLIFENPAAVAALPISKDPKLMPGQNIIDAVGEPRKLGADIDARLEESHRMTRNARQILGLLPRYTENISMNWYLTYSELEAMKRTFPERDHRGAGDDRNGELDRQNQIMMLMRLVNALRDEPRDYALRALVQLENFDRLLALKNYWWWGDHASLAAPNR